VSVRLSVIVCQSSLASPGQRDTESDVVARLIGSPGIDLSLVGGLDKMDAAGTDRLVLERLNGDAAILAWHNPAEIADRLAALGTSGYRARHMLDPSAPGERATTTNGTSKHRLFLIDFGSATSAQIDTAVKQILQSLRVQTISLGIPGKAASPAIKPTPEDDKPNGNHSNGNHSNCRNRAGKQQGGENRAASPVDRTEANRAEVAESTRSTQVETTQPRSTDTEPARITQTKVDVESGNSTHWDHLVDELNELDI
jgi:hypothetical protein